MKLPFEPDAKRCHEDLKQTNAAYQQGFAALRALADSDSPFDERLHRFMKSHEATLAAAQTQPQRQTWVEEDVYLCCVWDLLQSMFAAEAQSIAGSSRTVAEKRGALDELSKRVDKLPFGSPLWRDGPRARIQKRLADARDALS
ncbi:MAG: hypothetical protein AB1714_09640 [Acidobacteriota bacterium]